MEPHILPGSSQLNGEYVSQGTQQADPDGTLQQGVGQGGQHA